MKKSMLMLLLSYLFFHAAYAGINRQMQDFSSDSSNEGKKPVAARIYFSNEIPIAGIAKEGKLFYIQPGGSYLYLIVDSYPSALYYSQLKVKIYRTENLLPVLKDERIYDINGKYTYTYIKYSFFDAGSYTFDIYSVDGQFIGTGIVDIKFKNSSDQKTVSTNDPYANSKVYFSTEAPVDGFAKNVSSFTLKRGGGYIHVIVDNYPNAFTVNSLKVYVYKVVNGETVRHDVAVYTLKDRDNYAWFKYNFYEPGYYKFVVFDEMNRYMNTGYVTIGW